MVRLYRLKGLLYSLLEPIIPQLIDVLLKEVVDLFDMSSQEMIDGDDDGGG